MIRKLLFAAFLLCLPLAELTVAQVEVIVATTGEKSDVGLAADSVGFMHNFSVSSDGSWWAGEFELDNSLDSIHMRGQGTQFSDIIWTEGDQAPGGLSGTIRPIFTERQTSINNSGHVAGLARHQVGGVIQGEYAYQYDGTNVNLLGATGQSITPLSGALYGDMASANIGNNGRVSFLSENITGTGITTANDEVTVSDGGLTLGGQQKGVTTYDGEVFQNFDRDNFFTDATGDRFILTGDTDGATAADDIVVLGDVGTQGNVVLRENISQVVTSQGTEAFDVASQAIFGGDDWFVAGDTVGGTGVVIRNGEVIASEGDLAPDGFRYSGDPLLIAADDMGNHAWVWDTDNPDLESDLLLVYNGSSILLREHDIFQFDIDGDGNVDEVRMDRLFDDFSDLRLAGGHAYLMTEIDDPITTVAHGWAFLRVSTQSVPEPSGAVPLAVFIAISLVRRAGRKSIIAA